MKTQTLTNKTIDALQPKEKLYKIHDGNGLFLYIRPNNKKMWVVQFHNKASNKRSSVKIGEYPTLSIAKARKQAIEQRVLLSNQSDLFIETRSNNTIQVVTLNEAFRMWLERWQNTVTPSYAAQVERAIIANVTSVIGDKDITTIEPIDIVSALTPMEARGSLSYLRRTKQGLNLIFDFAISRGLCKYNPAQTVKNNAFKAPEEKHLSALSPHEMPHFLNVLEKSDMQFITKCCILFQLVTLTRPSETTNSEWAEINLNNQIWVIPKERMKAKREHSVPLSSAAMAILNKMHVLTHSRQFVFTGRDMVKAMDRETPRIALRRLKPQGIDTTAHGLRALGSTYLNESGLFRSEVIEMSLAHIETNKVKAAYNRAEYLEERKELLEWWGNEVFKYLSPTILKTNV